MSSSPLLQEYMMASPPGYIMNNPSEYVLDNSPQQVEYIMDNMSYQQYAARLTNTRIANMARISQMLKHNAIMQGNQNVHNNNNAAHNAPNRVVSNNNMSMSSDSSLDSHLVHTTSSYHNNAVFTDTMHPAHRDGDFNAAHNAHQAPVLRRKAANRNAAHRHTMYCEQMAATPVNKNTTSACNRHSMYQDTTSPLATRLSGSVDDLTTDSPFSKFSKLRATFHGFLSGKKSPPKVVLEAVGKQELVVGKAILKLTIYVNSGMLTVHVKCAQHLESSSTSLCTSYVQASLVSKDSKQSLVPDSESSNRTGRVPATNHPNYDHSVSFELTEADHSKRLVLSVWNSPSSNQEGQNSGADDIEELLGCMSFGVSNVVKGKRSINGWYYLLKEDVGRRKHLQAVGKKSQA